MLTATITNRCLNFKQMCHLMTLLRHWIEKLVSFAKPCAARNYKGVTLNDTEFKVIKLNREWVGSKDVYTLPIRCTQCLSQASQCHSLRGVL